MSDIKLKDCPFCGGEAALHTADMDNRNWIAECKKCRCQTQWCGDKEVAAEKWNTRICGEWVYGEFDIPHCSECGAEVKDITPFCSQCGVKTEER